MAKKVSMTNIADALRCARKLKQGKACSMQELKSAVLLLETGMKSAKRGAKEARSRVDFIERLLNRGP